jgi:methylated-DNA-[protein]-cysteine S-methyltransferase
MEALVIYQLGMETPVGTLVIKGTADFICELNFAAQAVVSDENVPPLLLTCKQQLEEYFAGNREVFDFPISQPGTDFQQTVWKQLVAIPYGRTISYMQLAKEINNPKSIRAVGTTNGKNQLAIVVPCHRVIGSDGSLTGYAGGLWRKKWLLELERKVKHGEQQLFSME